MPRQDPPAGEAAPGVGLRRGEAQNLGQLGSVLASAARIEVAYAGVFSAELKDVTVEFGSAIEQIVAAVEQVKAAARAQGVRR